jgi:hypothetical protein
MGTILESIKKELLTWPYVTAEPHRFGGIEFRINKREMGHIHGDHLADLPYPMQIRNELINSGRVSPHHVMPQLGWVSYWIKGGEEAKEREIAAVIALFKMQYERLHHSTYKQGSYKADEKGTHNESAER